MMLPPAIPRVAPSRGYVRGVLRYQISVVDVTPFQYERRLMEGLLGGGTVHIKPGPFNGVVRFKEELRVSILIK